jgi:hypothetical protein
MNFELIFWLLVLGAWLVTVVKGLAWIEHVIDNYLDRFFARNETNGESDI